MADHFVEKFEKRVHDHERKRESLERELLKIRDEGHKLLDDLFDDLTKEIQPHLEESDRIIESCIKDFKKLLTKKKELKNFHEKLSPMLEMFHSPANNSLV